jgi:DHA1 family inner membrane transport protein
MSKKELTKVGLNRQQRFLIVSLFLITFTLGTSEFVIIGLLNDIASNLKISISEAGTLISGFAVAFAIGTPVLTAILSRFQDFH